MNNKIGVFCFVNITDHFVKGRHKRTATVMAQSYCAESSPRLHHSFLFHSLPFLDPFLPEPDYEYVCCQELTNSGKCFYLVNGLSGLLFVPAYQEKYLLQYPFSSVDQPSTIWDRRGRLRYTKPLQTMQPRFHFHIDLNLKVFISRTIFFLQFGLFDGSCYSERTSNDEYAETRSRHRWPRQEIDHRTKKSSCWPGANCCVYHALGTPAPTCRDKPANWPRHPHWQANTSPLTAVTSMRCHPYWPAIANHLGPAVTTLLTSSFLPAQVEYSVCRFISKSPDLLKF